MRHPSQGKEYSTHITPISGRWRKPHATRPRAAQSQFSVNVCADIVGDHLIGPYLLPFRLTGRNYLILLQQVLPHLLGDELLHRRDRQYGSNTMGPLPISAVTFVTT
ncbi:hypothetical protein AVEN_234516-1 [Araneus ventricosus]|uniref:Uncharacterized protein n=1 Tax=Araneus ventricosus TaxID=182803 RepID=A0A4Y2AA89_ARAVE|nr:hypothetical protein AVEN_234516-1 [Araneus ventricosus]